MADAGAASRRESEQFILAGRVTVDGRVVRLLGTKIEPGREEVALDGRPLKPLSKRIIALHKPCGCLSARRDGSGRKTVSDLLPKNWGHLYPVGRLDYDSEGLLLLTNNGQFCQRVAHPRHGIQKTYLVEVDGRAAPTVAAKLRRGISDQGVLLQAQQVRLLSVNNTRSRIELTLGEGKNREIRRMFKMLGHKVLGLKRIRIGPVRLGELPSGRWRILTPGEVRSILKLTGDPAGNGRH